MLEIDRNEWIFGISLRLWVFEDYFSKPIIRGGRKERGRLGKGFERRWQWGVILILLRLLKGDVSSLFSTLRPFPSPTPPTIAVLVSHTADIPPLYTFKAGGAQQWAGRIFTITDYRIRTGWREWKESRSYRSESHSNQTPYFHWTGLFSNGGIDTAIDAVSNWILLHWFCN